MSTNTISDAEEIAHSEREIEGFTVTYWPGPSRMNYAVRGDTQIDTTDTDFIIDREEGSGYMYQRTTAYIPFEVIAEMMRNAGYVCHPRQEVAPSVTEEDDSCGQNI
jgi:hypothetical protein